MRRECRERFPPPPISKETVSWRSRHASRHVRHARAVMHVGIACLWWRGNVPVIPGACAPASLRIWQEAHGVEGSSFHITGLWVGLVQSADLTAKSFPILIFDESFCVWPNIFLTNMHNVVWIRHSEIVQMSLFIHCYVSNINPGKIAQCCCSRSVRLIRYYKISQASCAGTKDIVAMRSIFACYLFPFNQSHLSFRKRYVGLMKSPFHHIKQTYVQMDLGTQYINPENQKYNMFSSSSSNFISRRIQYDTFHTHIISTISQMYSSGGCQRSSVAHRADNRYFNNDTAVGKQGARGNIFFIFPDVSSTLHSKYEWFNTSESNICL